MMLLVSALVGASGMRPRALPAQVLAVAYREPADVFEILDNVSNWWPGYTDDLYRAYWRDSVGFTRGDSVSFAQYAALRTRYFRKDGQGNSTPRRDGSGLFTDRVALDADPVADAFYRSETMEMAFARVQQVVNANDLRALRQFYERFAARVAPLVAQTRQRTEASRALTARTLALDGIAPYVAQVGRLFGVRDTVSFTALYVWWPDTSRSQATPNGRHLIMRVRPAADDTVNSADVVMHEAVHVLSALAGESQKQLLSGAILDRCTVPASVRRLVVVEEGIATALGNIEFRRRFMPQRFAWSRRWYGDDWVDLSARLLYPMLTLALAEGKPLGATFGRDAGAMCALQARLRTPPPS
jgi:hypothetical protein